MRIGAGSIVIPCVVVVAAAMSGPGTPAFACTPPAGGLPRVSVADHVRAAAVVFEGIVASVSGGSESEQTATITVQRYFKGQGPVSVRVAGYGSSALCLSAVSAGSRSVFWANGDPNGQLKALYLSQFDATAPANDQTFGEVLDVTQQTPLVPPQTPVAAQHQPDVPQQTPLVARQQSASSSDDRGNTLLVTAGIAVAFVVVFGLGTVAALRLRRLCHGGP